MAMLWCWAWCDGWCDGVVMLRRCRAGRWLTTCSGQSRCLMSTPMPPPGSPTGAVMDAAGGQTEQETLHHATLHHGYPSSSNVAPPQEQERLFEWSFGIPIGLLNH